METDRARQLDAIDDLLGDIDGIARGFNNYDYGLPMATDSEVYQSMREKVAAYGQSEYERGQRDAREDDLKAAVAIRKEHQEDSCKSLRGPVDSARDIEAAIRALPLRGKQGTE